MPSSKILPILVAELEDAGGADYLLGVALAGGVARVPLISAPMDGSEHALEIYTPGSTEPLVLMARSAGGPTPEGFPLKLRLVEGSLRPASKPPPPPPSKVPSLRPKQPTAHTLTARHTHDLESEGGKPAHNPRLDLVGRTLAGGKLIIEELVGSGGAGAVYKARHRELKMPIAVKVLHASYQDDVDFCRRFYAEALAASRLDHPNLTRVHDFGQEDDGLFYLAMEFLAGTNLHTILARTRRLEAERIATLMMQVCAALTHVHARGLIHRDIKPENLVIVSATDDEGESTELVKVCDFGIAQPSEGVSIAAGTPAYMSPEQCRGEPLDARSDVYSCGVVLYELATGTIPFEGELNDIFKGHMDRAPDPPSRRVAAVPPALDQVIMKALEKDPSKRQQSARDLRRELRTLLEGSATPSGAMPRVSLPDVPDLAQPESRRAAAVQGPPDQEWLDRAPISSRPATEPRTRSSGTLEAVRPPDALADALARDATPYLQRLASAQPAAFAGQVVPLDGAIRALLVRGATEALWKLVSTLDHIAAEGPQTPGSRAASAAAILKVLSDPSVLAPVAERALAEGEGRAESLLARAATSGAHAIYSARVKNASPEARERFKKILGEIGAAGAPLLRAALTHLEERLAAPGAADLAEDLLASVPREPDDVMGALVARYARVPIEAVAREATSALPFVWAERARPLLVALLQQHPHDVVRIAAVEALRELGRIDAHLVQKLDPLVRDRNSASAALRVSAASAVARAVPSAKGVAGEVLARALTDAPPARDESDEKVELEIARSLLLLGTARSRESIRERALASRPSHRRELEEMLAKKVG
jgi:serine/threonine protein kinase